MLPATINQLGRKGPSCNYALKLNVSHHFKTHFVSSFIISHHTSLSFVLKISSLILQKNKLAAELLLTFAMEETLKRLSSIAAEGIRLAWGFEGQLRKLNQSLTTIKDVLQDAARRAVTDESVKRWLQNLQVVAYDAEDVLDEFAYEILRKEQKKGKVCDCFSLHNPVAFRLIMGQKVKKINEALDEIRKDASGFGLGLTSLPVDSAQEVSWGPDRETDSFLDRSEIVGRKDDVSIVMDMLTSLTKHRVLSVVPIVGMVGLGKTTVAKNV